MLAKAHTARERYLAEPSPALSHELDAMVCKNLLGARSPGLARAWFEGLLVLARSAPGCELLCDLARSERTLARLDVQTHDRVRAAAAAIARGRPIDRHRLLASLAHPAARRKAQLLLAAASPRLQAKRSVFERYLSDHALAEDWIVASLPHLNDPAHALLTLPLLAPAIAAVPRLARMKKIFFLDRWLESFLGGQHSAEALACARAGFKATAPAPELAQKVREAIAELRRAISIRKR